MKIYNRTATTIHDLQIRRFFDGDINGTAGNDRALATLDAVSMFEAEESNWESSLKPRGLSLGAGILDKRHFGHWAWYNSLGELFENDNGPSYYDDDGSGLAPIDDDYIGDVTYTVGDIAPGGVKTVSFIYRRF